MARCSSHNNPVIDAWWLEGQLDAGKPLSKNKIVLNPFLRRMVERKNFCPVDGR
jgi:hypothetical protein